MFDLQRTFHTGIVVSDLEKAKQEVGASLNLDWTPVRIFDPLVFWTPERGLFDVVTKAVYSRQGPHHLEICQGPAGTFYDPSLLPDGRHIGVWVDDLPRETEELLSAGWRILAANGRPDDGYGVISYLAPPTSAFVVELVSIDLKPAIDEWLVETE